MYTVTWPCIMLRMYIGNNYNWLCLHVHPMMILLHKCFIMVLLLIFTGVCPVLQNPDNGKVIVQEDMAFFVCLAGTVVMGNPILTCINGNWNNPPPTCKLLN